MGEQDYVTRGTYVPTVIGTAKGIGADPRRVALVASVGSTFSQVSIRATGAPDANHQITLVGSGSTQLTFKDVGPLVAYGWDVVATAALIDVYLVEVLYVGTR